MRLGSTILLLLTSVQAEPQISGSARLKEFGTFATAPTPLSIECFDEDHKTADDLMVRSSTQPSFQLTYKQKTGVLCGWDCGFSQESRRPDIYCTVESPTTFPYRTDTYKNWPQNLDLGTITLHPKREGCVTNGCTAVPDLAFLNACNNHDCCYAACGETQQDCDDEFYELMLSECRVLYGKQSARLNACYSAAFVYYTGVVLLGQEAFDVTQSDAGCNGRTLVSHDTGRWPSSLLFEIFPEDHEVREVGDSLAWMGAGVVGLVAFGLVVAVVANVMNQRHRDQQGELSATDHNMSSHVVAEIS